MLRILDQAWEWLLKGLMALAALYVGLIMLAIIYMTICRTLGISYYGLTHTVIEYGFVYILFLGSPWLIRSRGHVYIEMLTAAVPDRVRRILSRIIAIAAAAICMVWAWYSWQLFVERWDDPMQYDELRAQHGIHLWVSTIVFPFGFLLMALEFLRFVFTREPMHTGQAGVASDRAELEQTRQHIQEGR